MTHLDWRTGGGTLIADGKRLEWATFGPPPARTDGPTIAMLHEGLGCIALWRDFPERLAGATGLPVFVFSRAGYGRSDPAALPRPLDYLTREAVEVLPQVLDTVGADRVVLFGHSDGATIAAEHAGRIGDARIVGLILMAPHFFTEPVGLAEIARARTLFATGDLKQRLGKYHRDAEATFRGWSDAWLDPDFRDWNVTGVIDALRTPVLAIQGRDDQYATLAQIEVIERRSGAPVETLVLDRCRHSPHLECPERVLEAVATFIARPDPADAPATGTKHPSTA